MLLRGTVDSRCEVIKKSLFVGPTENIDSVHALFLFPAWDNFKFTRDAGMWGGKLPPGPVCLNGLEAISTCMLTLAFTICLATHKHVRHTDNTTYTNVTFYSTAYAHACTHTQKPFLPYTCNRQAQLMHVLHMKKKRSIALTERSCSFLVFFFLFFSPKYIITEKRALGGGVLLHITIFFFLSPCSNSTCTPWLCCEICQCFHYF